MRYTALSSLDQTLRISKEYSFRKVSLPVSSEKLTLEGLLCTPKGRSQYYYAVEHPKKRILLHFTAGNIRSDLSALTMNNRHVSVPFVLGRDGTIYQLFSSKFWSGNIGKGIGNTNTGNAEDKVTISIEISNYGYLTARQDNLETYYSRQKDAAGKPGPIDIYCSLADKEAYQKLNSPFRGQSYYATYTEAQYESLIILLRYLTAQYNIPRQFLPEPKRYEATEDVLSFKGIVSHVNYRKDGKWDIGPAFNWKKVIEGVQAKEFVPTINPLENLSTKDILLEGIQEVIDSEDQLERFVPEGKDPKYEDEPYEEIQRNIGEEENFENEKIKNRIEEK
ncbi:MAG TPA: N-acetylmuramoyl-L-alanine amidase [Chitinophagaceae bacterium]|jgi:N-acetyl-anhydromuramyl-L-alanine amidase AmpD|nr:N-acetylmuramoyl-L-alanine amidase [Chitinophagaceae bacterium]